MKQLGIIGCGWLGLRLAKHFANAYQIHTTTTSIIKKETLLANGFDVTTIAFSDQEINTNHTTWDCLLELEALIITVPFSKQMELVQLKNRFENISNFIGGFNKPIFLISSTGIYPDVNVEINEHTFMDDELHANLIGVENLMREKFTQINVLRLGGIMGDDRYLSKYNVSNTEQPVNHVHYQDVGYVIEKMLTQNCAAKTYNVVAPLHPSKSAVMNYQKKILDNSTNTYQPPGRIIKADALRDQLNYIFRNPDPRKFK